MRETRQSGSEGGAWFNPGLLPLSADLEVCVTGGQLRWRW